MQDEAHVTRMSPEQPMRTPSEVHAFRKTVLETERRALERRSNAYGRICQEVQYQYVKVSVH